MHSVDTLYLFVVVTGLFEKPFYTGPVNLAILKTYSSGCKPPSCLIQVLSVFRKVFGEDFEPYSGSREFHITPLNLQVCQSKIS